MPKSFYWLTGKHWIFIQWTFQNSNIQRQVETIRWENKNWTKTNKLSYLNTKNIFSIALHKYASKRSTSLRPRSNRGTTQLRPEGVTAVHSTSHIPAFLWAPLHSEPIVHVRFTGARWSTLPTVLRCFRETTFTFNATFMSHGRDEKDESWRRSWPMNWSISVLLTNWLLPRFFEQNRQIFSDFIFSNKMICCFPLFHMISGRICLGFRLLFGLIKSENVTLGSGKV